MAATTQDWIAGARLRTLTTAVAPVAVGTASAYAIGAGHALATLLALGVALALQVAANYANDYADGIRGTDVDRIGPERLVGSGKVRPSLVKRAAWISFGVAAVLGLALTAVSREWWMIAVGLVAVIAAWTYTGSKRPYGYAGFGEVSVFVFFGLVATLGTMFAQAHAVTWWAIVGACSVGLHAVALLLVNNIRDLNNDVLAGKNTLAVMIGDVAARHLFTATMVLPLVGSAVIATQFPWALTPAVLLLAPTVLIVVALRAGLRGGSLKIVFAGVSALGLAYGLMLAVGIALG